jgi:hypothetical protein
MPSRKPHKLTQFAECKSPTVLSEDLCYKKVGVGEARSVSYRFLLIFASFLLFFYLGRFLPCSMISLDFANLCGQLLERMGLVWNRNSKLDVSFEFNCN